MFVKNKLWLEKIVLIYKVNDCYIAIHGTSSMPIEKELNWVDKLVTVCANYIHRHGSIDQKNKLQTLSGQSREDLILKSVQEKIRSNLKNYLLEPIAKCTFGEQDLVYIESQKITYWLARLTKEPALSEEDIDYEMKTIAKAYPNMRSSTDLDLCLKKIGEGLVEKYSFSKTQGDWCILLGFLLCYKLWLVDYCSGDEVDQDEEEFFAQLPYNYIHVIENPRGKVSKSDRCNQLNSILDAAVGSDFITSTTGLASIPQPSIPKSYKLVQLAIHTAISQNQMDVENRFRLIMLNRWIETLFPIHQVNLAFANRRFDKGYFLWLLELFSAPVISLGNTIPDFEGDECGANKTPRINYFGKKFGDEFIAICKLISPELTNKLVDVPPLLFETLKNRFQGDIIDKKEFDDFIAFLYRLSSGEEYRNFRLILLELSKQKLTLSALSILVDAIENNTGYATGEQDKNNKAIRIPWTTEEKNELINTLRSNDKLFREEFAKNRWKSFYAEWLESDGGELRRRIRDQLGRAILDGESKPEDALLDLLKITDGKFSYVTDRLDEARRRKAAINLRGGPSNE